MYQALKRVYQSRPLLESVARPPLRQPKHLSRFLSHQALKRVYQSHPLLESVARPPLRQPKQLSRFLSFRLRNFFSFYGPRFFCIFNKCTVNVNVL